MTMSDHIRYPHGITVAETPPSELDRCNSLRAHLRENGFFTSEDRWRLSSEPFYIPKELSEFLKSLGEMLLSFYRALNNLYFMALKGRAPSWIVEYLDMGKPDSILRYSRMKRFKNHLPIIIRPDILITEKGIVATELDAVPGGMGITAALSSFFTGYQPVGGGTGMVEGFISAFKSLVETTEEEINLAFVISDESDDYRGEMEYIAGEFRKKGFNNAHTLHPREVIFKEEGLFVRDEGRESRLHIVYRFFELFDTVNIPKAELIFYAAKQKKVVLTPPIKPFLEEKLAYALFHHPGIKNLWIEQVGEEVYYRLKELFPRTWILDPRMLPPYGVIPDLEFRGQAVSSWDFLRACTQKERRYVIKPSGFSELAWGGRGVVIGHDLPLKEWNNAIDRALEGFYSTPCILQEFKKGRRERARYLNTEGNRIEEIEVRARLTPYYFVCGEDVRLSGVLATLCPADKKILHGMKDAIMTVCAVSD